MGLLKYLGALSPAYTNMMTAFSGAKRIGEDMLGNVYYTAKPRPGYKHERRWVIYNGEPEPSKVPPEWHGWLHHQTDVFPGEDAPSYRRTWQKPARANLTGTTQAYRPPGHMLEGGQRDKATGDYKAWRPPE